MSPKQEPPRKLWQFQERTRFHTYYTPTGNLQGVLLFALIAVLGVVAIAFVAVHFVRLHGLQHQDGVLVVVGFLCAILGTWQAWNLSRRA
jgi:hypothetical protein